MKHINLLNNLSVKTLLACMLFLITSLQSWGFVYGGFTYEGTSESGLTVVGCSLTGDVTVPASITIDEIVYGVKTIGGQAFENRTDLTSIVVSNGVTRIEGSAFLGCSGLVSLTIPESVTYIGTSAFEGCTGTLNINCNIPNPVHYDIGVFYGSKFTGLVMGDGVKSVGWNAFGRDGGNSTLTSVTFGSNVESIGDNAFAYCTGLTTVSIPASVKTIGGLAFFRCTGLTTVSLGNGVETIGGKAFAECTELKSVTIRSGAIEYSAFASCSKLKTLSLGSRVTKIGDGAFSGCSSLKTVTVPKKVTTIGSSAFYGCTSLQSITIPSTVTAIGQYAFGGGCTGKATINCSIPDNTDAFYNDCRFTEIVIGEGVTRIGSNAFKGNPSLLSLTLPEGLQSIGSNAFYDCPNLASANIPASVTSIENGAFQICRKLDLTPGSVLSCEIGNNAFDGCNSLTSVTFGSEVGNIGGYAFRSCSELTTVTVPDDVTKMKYIGTYAFSECGKMTDFAFPSSLDSLGYAAFEKCSSLPSIHLKEGIRIISESAFFGCSGVTSAVLPSTIQNIGSNVFNGCQGTVRLDCNITDVSEWSTPFGSDRFSHVIIGAGVTELSDWTFWRNQYIEKVTVENPEPIVISGTVFSHRSNITLYVPQGSKAAYEAADYWKEFKEIVEIGSSPSIVFADANVKAICVANWDTNGDGELSEKEAAAVRDLGKVFKLRQDITSFDELRYFTGLTSIADSAFYYCNELTSVVLPANITSIGREAFYYSDKLTSVNILNGVTSIGYAAFEYSSLTSITIPESVNFIDSLAFGGIVELERISVSSSNPVFDSRDNCNAIIETASGKLVQGCLSTVIPSGVTSIGFAAFMDYTRITSIDIPDGVTEIGRMAFYNTGITSITLPESVSNIDRSAYVGCLLTSITVNRAIPPTVYYKDGQQSFWNPENITLYVPKGSKTAYEAAELWKECKEIIEFPVDPSVVSDLTSKIQNADFSSTEGWTAVVSAQYNALGNGLIGTYKVYGDNAATVDATHLATEYCFGFECRWSTNFAAYTQTINLPAGNYELSFDVENVNGSTTKASYENRFTVTVGETVYTDNSVEWMNGKSAWTPHTITFSLEAAADVTISLGYGTGSNNISSANTPILYVSHLALTGVAELPADPYEAALAAIGEGGNYFITTDVNGVKYYITAEGKLTSTRADGCVFTVSKVEGDGYKQYGYYIDGGKRFTNTGLSNNQAVLNVSSFSTTTNNRYTWEAQVLFLNEEGKYAIRATNAEYGESGWADAGRVFFTWKVEDAAVIPQYTYDQVYQWDFEVATSVNVTYKVVESDGVTEVASSVVKQEANSEVSVPASLLNNVLYDYAVSGTIGAKDCTITITRTFKAGVVHTLTGLSNAKSYTIGCDRGTFLTKNGYLASTALSSLNNAEPGIFAILNYEDNYYLYSVADKKFVTNTGALADMPTHGVLDAIQMEAKADPYFFWYFQVDENANYGLNTNGQDPYGYVINSWMTADPGNQYYMVEAADFDATNALQALGDFFHPSYFVTYVVKDATGNVLFTSDAVPVSPGQKITTLPDELKKDFTAYNEVDVTISDKNTTIEFTATPDFPFEIAESFADAKWYNMTIRSNYWVAMDETEPYYPKADKDLDANASKWAFQGDAYNGIVILNRAAGEGKSLTKDGSNVVMRDGAFKWEVFSNSVGFVMRPLEGEGMENMWVNQNGGSAGPLQFWNSAAGKTDNGSTFRITPATPVYAITCLDAENGSVVADLAEAKAGETVSLTITPAEGYKLDALRVVAANGNVVTVSRTYSFEMPAADVSVTATFTINSYTLTYKVDGEVYKTSTVAYGTAITPEAAPTKEGYTFSGWSEIPATMPARDVEVTGSFTVNNYALTYKVDGEVYKTSSVAYGTALTPEAEPTKDGYTFGGWSEMPETMPANDVVVTGRFYLFGDVNTDEEVDVIDVVDIARYVVGMPSEEFMVTLADINKNKTVNIGDAVTLVNYIAGDVNFVKPMFAPNQSSATDVLSMVKTNSGLALCLDNERSYTAFQFDLYVQEDVNIEKMMFNAQRKQKHQLLYNKVEDGHYRVAALSTSNNTFLGNEGELLSLIMNVEPNTEVTLRDIYFFDVEGNDYQFDDISFDTETGIASLQGSDGKETIYDLQGRRVSKKQRGINIVNGKKTLVK